MHPATRHTATAAAGIHRAGEVQDPIAQRSRRSAVRSDMGHKDNRGRRYNGPWPNPRSDPPTPASVRIGPAESAFTRMPCGPKSAAR